MFPTHASIHLEGASDPERLDYWNDVYGIDMSPMKHRATRELIEGGSSEVDVVPSTQICTDRYMLCNLDLNFVRDEELDFRVDFVLKAERNGDTATNVGGEGGVTTVRLDKLVVSFDIDFIPPPSNGSCT